MVRAAVALGVRKVRLTGGEPLVRRNLETLVAMLARIDGIDDLTLTTNASLLADRAHLLADAGLDRVTVSLDALDDPTFQAHERRWLPRLERSRWHRRRGGGRTRTDQDQRRDQARAQRARHPRPGRATSAARRRRSASSSTWTSGTPTDGASTTWCPPPRWLPRSTHVGRSSRSTPPIAARSRSAIGTATAPARSASSAASRSRSAATAPGPACRRTGSSSPASSPPPATTCAADPVGRNRSRAGGGAPRHLDRTRRPLLGAPHAGHDRAAEGGDELHRRC